MPIVFTKNGKNGVYIQYFWDIKAINNERKRIDALNRQIEANRAIKEQVKIKDKLIKEQKKNLEKIEVQQAELNHLEQQTQNALKKLNKIQSEKKVKDENIQSIIDRLECGITIRQLIDIYRKPDKYDKSYCAVDLHYGKFVVSVYGTSYAYSYKCNKKHEIYDLPINTIKTNHGAKVYRKLCNKNGI